MTYFTPLERRLVLFRRVRAVLVWLLALAVLSKLDPVMYRWLKPESEGVGEALKLRDWYQFLRCMGYLPTWIALGAALVVAGARPGWHAARRLGWAVALSAAGSGLVAEIVKRVVGRLRPAGDGEAYAFKGFLRGFVDTQNLGMPSSHAAVAFGAAWAVFRLAPGPGWVVLALAAGCGVTRLLSGAHFGTDVFVGATIGYASAWVVTGARPPARGRFPL